MYSCYNVLLIVLSIVSAKPQGGLYAQVSTVHRHRYRHGHLGRQPAAHPCRTQCLGRGHRADLRSGGRLLVVRLEAERQDPQGVPADPDAHPVEILPVPGRLRLRIPGRLSGNPGLRMVRTEHGSRFQSPMG